MSESKNNSIFVSRAALKIEPIISKNKISFKDKYVLDIGSSTGGFTQLALLAGARNVFAVELGTNQMDKLLRYDSRIDLHEKTNILDVGLNDNYRFKMNQPADIVLMDLSFVSITKILPHVKKLVHKNSIIIALVKPQFEALPNELINGIVKNEKIRRNILKSFEEWSKKSFKILDKLDSEVKGGKGNIEKIYILKSL